MTRPHIRGCRILLVEDEYLLADDLASQLIDAGAEVRGPVATIAEALDIIATATIDVAILDVALRDELSFPVADALRARAVPFLFMSGHGGEIFPSRFADVPRCDKPFPIARVIDAIGQSVAR